MRTRRRARVACPETRVVSSCRQGWFRMAGFHDWGTSTDTAALRIQASTHGRTHRLFSSAKRFCSASKASSSFAGGAAGGAGTAGAAAVVRLVRTTVASLALAGSTGGVTGRFVSKGGIEGALVGVRGGAAPVPLVVDAASSFFPLSAFA